MNFELFCDHAAHGRLAIVEQMLESGELVVSGDAHRALRRAAAIGHVGVVDCLLRHAMFDPAADDNYAVRQAAACGHLAVVERLLQDKRVDPSADDNYAVRRAAEWGHVAVVDQLLQDPRVDPSADDNYAVRLTARNGHIAVVERLLQDKRVDPSAEDNLRRAKFAAQYGHLAVVELLMQDVRVDPSANDNYAVRMRCSRTATSRSSIGCSKMTALTLLSLVQHSRPEDTQAISSAATRLTEICIALQAIWSCRRGSQFKILRRRSSLVYTAAPQQVESWCARSSTIATNTPSSAAAPQ